MSNELVVGGVYISPIVPACLIALILTVALSAVLSRVGFFRLIWHRPLVEVAIFCILLAVFASAPMVWINL